jgi:enoyl-CoA hydratase
MSDRPSAQTASGEGAQLSIESLVATSDQGLVAATHGSARILVINRPEARNAMSYDFRRAFAVAISDAESDPAVKVVIVTGAAGNFSAGVDLKDHRAHPDRPMFRPHPAEAVRSMTKPVIAAVDGYCLTGGLEVALSCSFVIATTRARFADTHAKVGLFPSWGLSALLPSAVGARRARQMSLTGSMVDAPTALSWGLVNELTDPEVLLARCMEIAATIEACNEDSVRLQLEVIGRNDGAPLEVALDAETQAVERWRADRTAQ